jgi:hypothetical protein
MTQIGNHELASSEVACSTSTKKRGRSVTAPTSAAPTGTTLGSHTGNNAGPFARICSLTKAIGGSTTFLPSRRTVCRSPKIGRWCRICQTRLGRKSATVMAAEIQIHRLANSCRYGVNARRPKLPVKPAGATPLRPTPPSIMAAVQRCRTLTSGSKSRLSSLRRSPELVTARMPSSRGGGRIFLRRPLHHTIGCPACE